MFERDELPLDTLSDLARTTRAARLDQADVRIDSPPADLHHAFSENQVASKTWLMDRLHDSLGGRFGTVFVLGGWYGVLGAMLLNDRRFSIARVLSFDLDPRCAPVAERINARHAAGARFRALTADVCALDYAAYGARAHDGAGEGPGRAAPDLVINTSCEHMARTQDWYERVPKGMFQVYQSNDNFDCPEHVNCVTDLAAFKAQVPMSHLYFEGSLRRRRYSRFMLIGRK